MNVIRPDLIWPIAIGTLIALTVAILGGLLTELGDWYYSLNQPSWKPPDWAFGPAWTLIFTLSVISGVLAWDNSPTYSAQMMLIAAVLVNAVLNIAWSLLFFKLRRPDWALAEIILLWLSVAILMVIARNAYTISGWLLAPYLAWVTFAASVNYGVIRLNGPFNGIQAP